MFIGMDPPKHDRLKALFQRGFTPKRIAEHEDAIRAITRDVLDRLEGRETCDLVDDVAQPVVARVIGSFMGLPPEDDVVWARLMNTILGAGDPDVNPEGVADGDGARRAGGLRALRQADRRAPREPDRRPHERARARRGRRREARGARDRHGLLPADGRRQRQHQGDLLQRHARAARGSRAAAAAARRPVADPERGRGVAADVPRLRPLPPHRDERHRAARPADPGGRQGGHVVRLLQPRRDALRGSGPLRRHAQPRAPGVRRRRPPLLPGHRAGAARAADPARGDARALPADGARGRAAATSSPASSTSSRRCRCG